MPPTFVVVDGNNGTGKSSIVEHVRDRLDASAFHFSEAFVRFRRDAGLDTRVPPGPRLAYYLAASLELSELVRSELAAGRNVVCDRYVAAPLSLLVAEGAMDDDEVCRRSASTEAELVRPDITLLSIAAHPVASDRIRERARAEGRDLTPVEERSVGSSSFFEAREAALRRHARRLGTVVVLDTTDLSIEVMRAAAWTLVADAAVTGVVGADRPR
jgi:thymidylate kinase